MSPPMTPSLRRQTPPPPEAANGRARWPPLPERRSAAGGGGAGPGSQGPEPGRRDRSWGRSFGISGAAHRDPRGRRLAPLSNPTSPRIVPAGRSRPPGVTRRRQSLILLPGSSLRPRSLRAPGATRFPGRDPHLHRSVSEPQVGRRHGPAHAPPPSPSSPRCSRLPPPPKFRSYASGPAARDPRGTMEEPLGSPPAALSALEKNVAELTVMDVYDIASLVGHEFERVIDQHGCESIARLMPKVVRVLEILEVLVSRHHVAPELDELRLELDRLRVERMDRIEKERKHQKELELVEDVWRGEAQDLLSQIAQLQEENKQLLTNLNHKDVGFSEEEFQKQEGMSERERQVMKRLKEVVDKQRDEIRAKDRELGLKNEDIEALQQQQTRLMKINHDLRHRVTVVEAQGKALIEQKVELEADLQTKEQEMGSLRAELGKLRERLQGEHSQNGEEEAEIQLQPDGEECVSDSEKATLDLKDPNRPRFTLQELRDVLHERNELKSKVFLLQEELAYYKSEEIEEENRIPQPPPIIHPRTSPQPESGIKRLLFTAVMPMVAAGLILDDPTLQPVRRLVSLV